MSARAAAARAGSAQQGVQSPPGCRATAGGHNPWLIAGVVALATFMEVLDTTIANVALRYISGGLAVGPDEAAWVVTSYLVANAIVLTASSFWPSATDARRSSCRGWRCSPSRRSLCGFAWNLKSLLLFRVLQGLGGGGMAPLAQSDPRGFLPAAKRGQAFALYGVAVVVAPVVGPTLGGWLADNVLLALVLPDQRAGRRPSCGADATG